jgi:pilus assembly protein Flp/PilA
MIAALNAFLTSLFIQTHEEEDGQTLVEYGLILALVSLVAVLALTALGGGVINAFNGIIAQLP